MKRFVISTILFMFLVNTNSVFASGVPADFTGENFFRAPMQDISKTDNAPKEEKQTGSIPPLKLLRLKTKEYFATSDIRKEERAKRKAVKQALKDYKKNKVLNDAESVADVPSDKDIEHLEMAGVEESKSPQRVIITCDDMDYSTETAILNANGNVKVNFVQEETILKTDHLVYDKKSNHMSAVGNVVISKKGIDVYGDSINVDMNEENALIDKPLSKLAKVSISAERGYVYPNKVVQEHGSVKVDSSFPVNLEPHGKAPRLKKMMVGVDDKSSVDDFVGNSMYRIKVSNIIINSDKKLESLELRKAQIFKGDKKVFTLPWIKLYTNKNHDFVDGDFPELGSRRNLGMFIGPGWAIKLPHGCLLKVAPIATYRNKFGVGGFARFLSGTNTTELAYGTSKSKFVLRGEQELDDHLKLEYAANDYMDNWFLGRRMPKYGVNLVYEQGYNHKNFFGKGFDMKYTHNASFGLFADPSQDGYYKKLKGNEITTVRARYMAEVAQKIFNYENEDELLSADISIVGQGSAALYGTGETQFIGRIGPRLHTQYRRWMQDIGYFQSAYQDNTPLPVFDAYRYGRSNVYIREYIRLHRLLTLSWLGSLTFSDDRWNNNLFQECAFFVSVGPDDLKLNFGYDVIRQNAYVNFSLGLDPKGTVIDYDRLEIKNPENFKIEPKKSFYVGEVKPVDTTPKILQTAVVEEIDSSNEEDDEL